MPNVQKYSRSLLVASVLGALGAAHFQLGCDEPVDLGTPVPSTGDGTVVIDGQTRQYSVVLEESSLYIRVLLTDDCNLPFHNHVIRSSSNAFTFAMNADSPADSTFQAVVYYNGLVADDPADRALFPETSDTELSDSDREGVQESMYEQLDAEHYDQMTFSGSSFTSLNGSASATVQVDLKGTKSLTTLTGTATQQSDGRIVFEGEGTLDGGPYDIYNGFGDFCVSPIMPLTLTLVMAPTQ